MLLCGLCVCLNSVQSGCLFLSVRMWGLVNLYYLFSLLILRVVSAVSERCTISLKDEVQDFLGLNKQQTDTNMKVD